MVVADLTGFERLVGGTAGWDEPLAGGATVTAVAGPNGTAVTPKLTPAATWESAVNTLFSVPPPRVIVAVGGGASFAVLSGAAPLVLTVTPNAAAAAPPQVYPLHVGPSATNASRTVPRPADVPAGAALACTAAVGPTVRLNTDFPGAPDSFAVAVDPTSGAVTVKRTDNTTNGWAMVFRVTGRERRDGRCI